MKPYEVTWGDDWGSQPTTKELNDELNLQWVEYVPPKPILDALSTGNRLVLKNEEGTVILSSRPLCREHEWIEERTISRQYDRKTCTVCGLETNGSGSVFTLEFSSLE